MRRPNCIRRRLLRISEQCYSPGRADAICQWSALTPGHHNPLECSQGEDSALVGTIALDGQHDAIVVAFRGTLAQFGTDEHRMATALDWLNNAECAQISFRDKAGRVIGKVHRGFLEAVDNVWQGLEPRLKQLIDEQPARPIYVTGHSKGGAMANIAAMRISDEWPNATVRVVTFAGARPGDAAFADSYAKRGLGSVRYESWPDAVPELPPGPIGSWWLRTAIAPIFKLGKLKELRIADLQPFYPVGTRIPAGNWMADGARRGLAGLSGMFGFKIDLHKLLFAHAINSGTALDELVCSETGADRCDHQ
jgi:triacylglycerol lipase